MPLEPPVEFEHHTRVELDGDDGLDTGLEEALGEVSCTRPDLEDGVGGLEPGLGDDGVHQRRVLQDVLPLGLLERDTALQPGAPSAGASRRAVALLLDLATRHGVWGFGFPRGAAAGGAGGGERWVVARTHCGDGQRERDGG